MIMKNWELKKEFIHHLHRKFIGYQNPRSQQHWPIHRTQVSLFYITSSISSIKMKVRQTVDDADFDHSKLLGVVEGRKLFLQLGRSYHYDN